MILAPVLHVQRHTHLLCLYDKTSGGTVMKRIHSGCMKIVRGPMQPRVMIVLLVLLTHVLGRQHGLQGDRSSSITRSEVQKGKMALQIASEHSMGNFTPSLEMKENVGFLLTPPILLQEAMCEDIVITYPEE